MPSSPASIDDLTAEERERLGREWISAGLGEHASVAAFARFVLDLVSVGAPPQVIIDAARAIQDEVEHARLCFGIAREMTGQSASPGPLDLAHAFDHRNDPESILTAAIAEGCFNETISAELARAALNALREPRFRAALTRIVDDEQRHADLSWSFVEWMLRANPELRDAARATAECAFAKHARDGGVEGPDDLPEGYGHLRARAKAAVKDRVLRDTITPRVAALFGMSGRPGGPR